MIERGSPMTDDQLQAFLHGVEIGRGGTWLQLTEDQYRKLK